MTGVMIRGACTVEEDPYDENVRLDLVGILLDAGRLGETRRHYEVYAKRMREIDVDPNPCQALAGDGSLRQPDPPDRPSPWRSEKDRSRPSSDVSTAVRMAPEAHMKIP